jgi:hypothetical protein
MGRESISTTSRFYLRVYEGRDAEITKRLEELADDSDPSHLGDSSSRGIIFFATHQRKERPRGFISDFVAT